MKLEVNSCVLSLYETEYQEVIVEAERIRVIDLRGKAKLITFIVPQKDNPAKRLEVKERGSREESNLSRANGTTTTSEEANRKQYIRASNGKDDSHD